MTTVTQPETSWRPHLADDRREVGGAASGDRTVHLDPREHQAANFIEQQFLLVP